MRDQRRVDVAGAELGEIAGRHRLAAAGDVREGFDGNRVNTGHEVGALRERGQSHARWRIDDWPRPGHKIESDPLGALVLDEAVSAEEGDPFRPLLGRGDVERRFAGGPSERRDLEEQRRPDASATGLRQDVDRAPQRREFRRVHEDPPHG